MTDCKCDNCACKKSPDEKVTFKVGPASFVVFFLFPFITGWLYWIKTVMEWIA